jgi:HEAT repeat protein
VTSRDLLVVVAACQCITLAALVVAVFINRWIRQRRRAMVRPRRVVLDQAMNGWALGEIGPELLARALEDLPTADAVEALVGWAGRLRGDRWQALAQALDQRPWTARLRGAVRARAWWRRLQAARFLSVAATPADGPLVARLLGDPQPAVHIAASRALERIATPHLLRTVIERIPEMAAPVQAHYAAVLRTTHAVVVPLLVERLGQVYDAALPRLVEFAGRLGDAGLREAVTALASHVNPEVRVQAARALGDFPHAASVAALRHLTTDAAWEVRAQAVRALGRIADRVTLPDLVARLGDAVWWVRLRAALALTRLGDAGRDALLAAEIGPQQDARFVARLILGLTPQALTEFAA